MFYTETGDVAITLRYNTRMMKKNNLALLALVVILTIATIDISSVKNSMEALGLSSRSGRIDQSIGKTTLSGTYLNGHMEGEDGRTIPFYGLRSADTTYNLNFNSDESDSFKNLEGGSTITLTGTLTGREFSTTLRSQINLPTEETHQKPLNGPEIKKVAIILFNFVDDNTEINTKDAYRHLVYDKGGDTVAGYYDEISNGKLIIEGKNSEDGSADVYGWYTIPYSKSTCPFGWAFTWTDIARKMAIADGFNSDGYNIVAFVNPPTNACGNGVSAVDLIPPPHSSLTVNAWLNGARDPIWFFHEFGHAMGLMHASAYNCYRYTANTVERVSMSNNCQNVEYGDPYDVMGGWITTGAYHYGNAHKSYLDLVPRTDIKEISSSGIYTLYPAELSGSGTHAIRIPYFDASFAKNNFYYLEYRQPHGWDKIGESDAVANGISVRIASSGDYGDGYSYLIDTTPETMTFLDAPLSVGKVFRDTDHGISVKLLSLSKESAQVEIGVLK